VVDVVTVVVLVLVEVTVDVGPVTVLVVVVVEVLGVGEEGCPVLTVFSTVVVWPPLAPLAIAYAIPPPTSRAMTAARAIQPGLAPRRGLRSYPQLGQNPASAATGAWQRGQRQS
jgi:hypothetical protein